MNDETCNGTIDYRGDPYNVDFDGYYCVECGLTGAEDKTLHGASGQNVPHRKGIGGYERDVFNAAMEYRNEVTYAVQGEFSYEKGKLHIIGKAADLNMTLLDAVERLVAARTLKGEE